MRGIFFTLFYLYETRDRALLLLLLVPLPANGRDARVSAFCDENTTNGEETTTLERWWGRRRRRRRHHHLKSLDDDDDVGVGERADENETVEARAARAVARRVFASVVVVVVVQ